MNQSWHSPRRAGVAALSVAVLLLSLAAALPARADLEVKGTVSQVVLPPDPTAGAYGALTLSNDLGSITLHLQADTRIEVADQPATLADVHVGDTVEAKYVATASESVVTFWATRLEVERPCQETWGVVTRLTRSNLDPSVIEVTLDPPTRDPLTLRVDSETKVVMAGRKNVQLAALSDEELAALRGSYARAGYVEGAEETLWVKEIHFQRARRLPFRGVVQGTEGNLLYVAVGEDEVMPLLMGYDQTPTAHRGAATMLRLHGKPARLSDLQAGDLCHGIYYMLPNSDTAADNLALVVMVRWPRAVPLTGTISAVSASTDPSVVVTHRGRSRAVGSDPVGTLELALQNDGTTVTVTLYKETSIRINGKPARFEELQVGQKAHALCIPRPNGIYHCFRLRAQK